MKTKAELFQYLHRCAFSSVVHTWTKAIDTGHFATWPGLTSELVHKHLPKSPATTKGNLKQDRQNIRLTKPSIAPSPIVPPIQHDPPGLSHQVFVEIIELTGKVSTDQTGRSLVTSSCGNKYLMVLYNHSNAVIPDPIKSRSESELIQAYTVLHPKRNDCGLCPNFQMLDNECLAGLNNFMRREGVTFQLVPPHLHQTNSSETCNSDL